MAIKSDDLTKLIKSSTTNPDYPGDLVLVRVDGLDYAVREVRTGSDGILGNYVVLETQPISEII